MNRSRKIVTATSIAVISLFATAGVALAGTYPGDDNDKGGDHDKDKHHKHHKKHKRHCESSESETDDPISGFMDLVPGLNNNTSSDMWDHDWKKDRDKRDRRCDRDRDNSETETESSFSGLGF